MAVLAPMPSASVSTTVKASPLVRDSERNATLKSLTNDIILLFLSEGQSPERCSDSVVSRIGAIGRRDFAVFPVQGQRGLRMLKGHLGDKMSVGAQMVVVLNAFVERSVPLVLGH